MEGEYIIYFAFMDFEVNIQREQQECKRLAKTRPVIFVECPFSWFVSLQRNDWRSDLQSKRRRRKEGISKSQELLNLYLYTPPASWFPFTRIPLVNKLYYSYFLYDLRRRLKRYPQFGQPGQPILWITQPATCPVIGRLNEELVVADWCNTWEEWFAPFIFRRCFWKPLRKLNLFWKRYWIKKLLTQADIVFVIDGKYYEYASKYSENVFLFSNGADVKTFRGIINPEVPEDMLQIAKPRLGAVSANITDQVINWDLIMAAADKHPEWSFVFIGRVGIPENHEIRRYNNVHFLGRKPHSELPRYLAHLDVTLTPYHANTLTQSGIGTKLLEYLIMGEPVVSSYLPQLDYFEDFKKVQYLAKTPAEFVLNIEKALLEDSDERKQERISLALKYDWDSVVADMESKIAEVLRHKERRSDER